MNRRIASVRRVLARGRDRGMTTAEYAVGIMVACSFALVLLAVVKSGPVKAAITKIVTSALGLAG